MVLIRRCRLLAFTIFFVAVFSAFAWSDDGQPRSFDVDGVGHGRPMIPLPSLSSSPTSTDSTFATRWQRFERRCSHLGRGEECTTR